MPRQEVVVAEPQCAGPEHAQFNAALLVAIHEAYPSAPVTFLAESTHITEVLSRLAEAQRETSFLFPVLLPVAYPAVRWLRFLDERCYCQKVVLEAGRRARFVVFSSISASMLAALSGTLKRCAPGVPVVAIPHSVLAGLQARSRRPWNWPLEMRSVLRCELPRQLTLIALTETILRTVRHLHASGNWAHIDIPYLFGPLQARKAASNGRIRVAVLGALRSAVDGYALVMESARIRKAPVTFSLAGYLATREAQLRLGRLFDGPVHSRPIPWRDYNAAIAESDYVFSLHSPGHYSLTASARFCDAVNHATPGFYNNSPLIAEYTARFGPIGHTRSAIGELADLVGASPALRSSPEYLDHVDNLLAARAAFAPETAALRLRSILGL